MMRAEAKSFDREKGASSQEIVLKAESSGQSRLEKESYNARVVSIGIQRHFAKSGVAFATSPRKLEKNPETLRLT